MSELFGVLWYFIQSFTPQPLFAEIVAVSYSYFYNQSSIWDWNNYFHVSFKSWKTKYTVALSEVAETNFSWLHVISRWYLYLHLSHVMRKPFFAICQQQRRRSACACVQSDQRLCFCCLDSIIPLVSISKISSLYLASVAAQTWSQTPKTGFLMTWLILYHLVHYETFLCWLCNLRKDILYNCLKNLFLFVEKINIKCLEINVK